MGSGETRNAALSLAGLLREGETLTGTPTVTISPSGPTLSNKTVNTSVIEINGDEVEIGEAVTFRVAGGASTATRYTITVTVSTTESQVLVAALPLILV